MKRLLDIILCLPFLAVFLPFGLIIAVILKLTGEHEIFYYQTRVGKGGRKFGLIKFATMLKASPSLGTGTVTLTNDPRVFPFGKFLRKTKLNEVPQLLNIMKGDMTWIGPRPQVESHFNLYSEDAKKAVMDVTPGLSGIGSIIFRGEDKIISLSNKDPKLFYKEDIMPYKGLLEIWYDSHRGFRTDLLLFFLTVWVILFPSSRIYRRIFPDLPVNHNPELRI